MELNESQVKFLKTQTIPALEKEYIITFENAVGHYHIFDMVDNLLKVGIVGNATEYHRMYDGAKKSLVFSIITDLNALGDTPFPEDKITSVKSDEPLEFVPAPDIESHAQREFMEKPHPSFFGGTRSMMNANNYMIGISNKEEKADREVLHVQEGRKRDDKLDALAPAQQCVLGLDFNSLEERVIKNLDLDKLKEDLMLNIEESLLESSSVDYPAGMEAGHSIHWETNDAQDYISEFSQRLIDYCMKDVIMTLEMQNQKLNEQTQDIINANSEVTTMSKTIQSLETVTFVNKQPVGDIDSKNLIGMIAATKAEVAELEKIDTDSAFIANQITELNDLIEEVTDILDERVED